MGRLKQLPIYIASALLLQLTVSCSESYCGTTGSEIPLVGLYAFESPDTEVSIEMVSVYGVGQKEDSVLYNEATLNSFYTPLDPTKNSVEYVIRYDSEDIPVEFKYDTLTYNYTRNIMFDTPECGAVYQYNITEFKYTTHIIKYASLITPVVDNLASETIHIFYAVQE